MKKLLIGVFTLCVISQLSAQDITGSWIASVPAGGTIQHLVFNIAKNGGTYTSTFDSPGQKVFGLACSKTYRVKDSVFIEAAVIRAVYKGLWDGKGAINGVFKQGSSEMAMNLQFITDEAKAALFNDPVRPQTPKKPYGYYSEEVEYDNAAKTQHYGATFTRPNGDGKYPAVIIITGSGTQDRDGTIFGHKFYWVLADYLSKNGIAVLRVDDRGAGKSTFGPDFKNATSVDFSYDVETSLNYLETRADVDKKHLGLIGHSEGGIIAPMVAARRKDVSFIVMWGAPEAGGMIVNTEQNKNLLKAHGVDSIALNSWESLHIQLLNLFKSSASTEILDQKIPVVFDAWKKAQKQKTLDALYVHDNSILGQEVIKSYNSLYDLPWMRFFIAYTPKQDLSKVKCSVLAINGVKDTQVNPVENLPLIKSILTQSGNKDFEIVPIPNLNHLLQTAVTGDESEYEKIDETISPVALNIICSWVKLHTK